MPQEKLTRLKKRAKYTTISLSDGQGQGHEVEKESKEKTKHDYFGS